MSYTLGQAARATGKSKPTIARAIRAGRLSAARAPDGSFAIDPAELERAFRITGTSDGQMNPSVPSNGTGDGSAHSDRLVLEQAETIRDLRARLDASEAERRTVQARLDALLTDQRPNASGGGWRRLLPWRRAL